MISLSDQIRQPLLKTKLSSPQLRASLVSRPRLLRLLSESERRILTLICAPAGYGKTTLLLEWIASFPGNQGSRSPKVCWLSMDEGDNDPIRFLSYLLASLDHANLEMSAQLGTLLSSFPAASSRAILSLLINQIEDLAFPIYQVLDDYQFISNPEIHEELTFLLDHLPANLHLVIATRSDPPLPLHRLRARNQLVEVRAEALQFTQEEVAAFMNRVMQLSLSAEEILALETRTEGWVTGLQMAALSMVGRTNVSQFIQSFSGSHRYILDYLGEEVFNRQPEKIQRFLMLTSILERFCASLCAAVLEESVEYSQITLQTLERANLFMVALDDERCWFRYHHLFGDILQTRIQHSAPKLISSLHARASAWYEQNGWMDEAVNHSIKSRNWEIATRLVEQNIHAYLSRGQLATVMKWIDVLPQELLLYHPLLSVRIATALMQAGKWYLTDTFAENAEKAIENWENHPEGPDIEQTYPLTPQKMQWIRANVTLIRAVSAIHSGNPSEALAPIQSILIEQIDIDPELRAWLHWAEGLAYRILGDLEQAVRSFSEAIRISQASGNVWWDFWADLAYTTRTIGKLTQAGEQLSKALRLSDEHQAVYPGNLGRVEAYLSSVYLEQNRLEDALEHARKSVEYIQWWPSQNAAPTAYAYMALIYLAFGDLDRATTAAQQADQECRKGRVTPFTRCLVEEVLARVWLVQGDRAALEQWVHEKTQSLSPDEEGFSQMNLYREAHLTMLARIWLETAEADRSRDALVKTTSLLARLEKFARTHGHGETLIEVLTLKVRAFHIKGSPAGALKTLEECLGLAETGGYIQKFVDAGESMRDLLTTYLYTPDPLHKPYAQRLLAAFAGSSRSTPTADSQAGLVEPLTARELDVLRLIAAGYSNRQIAEKLVLAEGTVKFYVHAVLEKLQVHSRTQAIIAAKERSLI